MSDAVYLKSCGMVTTPAITLNSRYHWVPNIIRTIAAIFNPKGILRRYKTRIGNNAVAGTDAAICTNGCKKVAALLLLPISTPTGIVHSSDNTNDAATLNRVTPALSRTSKYFWNEICVR